MSIWALFLLLTPTSNRSEHSCKNTEYSKLCCSSPPRGLACFVTQKNTLIKWKANRHKSEQWQETLTWGRRLIWLYAPGRQTCSSCLPHRKSSAQNAGPGLLKQGDKNTLRGCSPNKWLIDVNTALKQPIATWKSFLAHNHCIDYVSYMLLDNRVRSTTHPWRRPYWVLSWGAGGCEWLCSTLRHRQSVQG